MCRRVSCSRCGKYTYAGCGNHVDQVLSGVPAAQRCSCGGKSAAAATAGAGRRSWWPFGRG